MVALTMFCPYRVVDPKFRSWEPSEPSVVFLLEGSVIFFWVNRYWGKYFIILLPKNEMPPTICRESIWRESWFPVCQPISSGVTYQNSRDAFRKNGGYGKPTLGAALRPIFSGSIAPIFTNYMSTERYVSRLHNGVWYAAFGREFWPLETKNWQKICHARWHFFSEDLTPFKLTLWQRLTESSIFRHSRSISITSVTW